MSSRLFLSNVICVRSLMSPRKLLNPKILKTRLESDKGWDDISQDNCLDLGWLKTLELSASERLF